MNKYVEFEGKDVEQALEAAGKKLDRPVDDLRYDVVSYGSSGIFGLVGKKKAKIRVKSDSHKRSGVLEKDAKSHAIDLVKDTFGETDKDKPAEPVEETQTPAPDTEKAVADGCHALQRIVDTITEEARIEVEQSNGQILLKVEGGNSALLIGKRGQTLEAIQYLVEKIVNKQNEARVRILVDVEGYLATRKANLKRLAGKMADKAKKINKPVTIGQMNAYDRRIVHLHLKENPAVRTQSVGEGYYRKLVIFPKRRRKNKPNRQKKAE